MTIFTSTEPIALHELACSHERHSNTEQECPCNDREMAYDRARKYKPNPVLIYFRQDLERAREDWGRQLGDAELAQEFDLLIGRFEAYGGLKSDPEEIIEVLRAARPEHLEHATNVLMRYANVWSAS